MAEKDIAGKEIPGPGMPEKETCHSESHGRSEASMRLQLGYAFQSGRGDNASRPKTGTLPPWIELISLLGCTKEYAETHMAR